MADQYLPPIVAKIIADTSAFSRKLKSAQDELKKTGDSATTEGGARRRRDQADGQLHRQRPP